MLKDNRVLYHRVMSELELAGKIALVIGSATGIGAASAATLAHRGASVLLADIAADVAAQRAAEIRDAGGDADSIACDVRDEAQVAAAVAAAVDRWGGLDIVHNNAAAMHLVPADGPVAQADADHWDDTFDINLRGQMFGCKHAIPAMIDRGSGCIINTSSASGVLGDLGLTAYGAAKAAIIQLTKAVATQYGRQSIRCNAIIPGLVDVNRAVGTGLSPEKRQLLEGHQLLPIHAGPQEIADVVAFLASDGARFITGHALVVDGGLTVHMPTYADILRSEATS